MLTEALIDDVSPLLGGAAWYFTPETLADQTAGDALLAGSRASGAAIGLQTVRP